MKYFLCLFCCAWLLPLFAHADIRINEIAWMGTTTSQYSEWIELYNDADNEVSLAGWKLYKTGKELFFTLTKTIAAKGYLLIERTTPSAPDAVPGISDEAGPFAAGGLKNTGEDITLTDKDGNTIDSALFASGWPAGDAKTKETMQWNGSKWITAVATPDAPTVVPDTSPVVDPVVTQPTTQTIVVSDPVVIQTSTTATATPIITAPSIAVSTPIVTYPVPVISVPSTTAKPIVATTETVSVPIMTVIDSPSKNQTAIAVSKPIKKSTITKTKTVTPTVSVDTASNDVAADQFEQTSDATTQENSHTKFLILGAAALIGTALFLLLMRFNARQE